MSALAGPVLNSDEAAKYCGYRGGGQTMRDLKQKDPELPWHKLGRVLVFYPAELDAWIAKRIENKRLAVAAASRDINA